MRDCTKIYIGEKYDPWKCMGNISKGELKKCKGGENGEYWKFVKEKHTSRGVLVVLNSCFLPPTFVKDRSK